MKSLSRVLILLLFAQSSFQCTPENESNEYDIAGKAQKGPFVVGTNVTISELDDNLNPTGKIYFSTIMNNEGYFDLPEVDFVSDFVQLKIEGNHFHENIGLTFTNEPITLYCLADLTQLANTNINLLTHLEKDLVIKYKHDGMSFKEAKARAQKDVLKIFSLDEFELNNSEVLDISAEGKDNAILLAITAVIQGNLTGMRLTSFLTRIRADLNDNGTIDSEDLQTQLIDQAWLLYPPDIRENLENYYDGLNKEYEIPYFEEYIDTFIANSPFKSTVQYTIPESTENGFNLLSIDSDTIFIDTSLTYSLSLQTGDYSQLSCGVQIGRFWSNGEYYKLDNISGWTFVAGEFPINNFMLGISNQANVVADAKIKFMGEGAANMYVNVYCTISEYQYISFDIDRTLVWGN